MKVAVQSGFDKKLFPDFKVDIAKVERIVFDNQFLDKDCRNRDDLN